MSLGSNTGAISRNVAGANCNLLPETLRGFPPEILTVFYEVIPGLMTHLLRLCEFFCAPRRARSPEIPKRMNRIFALVTRVCTFLGIPCHKWKFGPSPPLAYYSKLQFFCSENVLSPKRVLQKNTDSSEKMFGLLTFPYKTLCEFHVSSYRFL